MSNLHVVIVIPAFSSTWVKDIPLMVDTQGIKSDARGHFIDDVLCLCPLTQGEFNPMLMRFGDGGPTSKELEEIRVTGGELLMIPAYINCLIGLKKQTSQCKKYASCYKQQLNG